MERRGEQLSSVSDLDDSLLIKRFESSSYKKQQPPPQQLTSDHSSLIQRIPCSIDKAVLSNSGVKGKRAHQNSSTKGAAAVFTHDNRRSIEQKGSQQIRFLMSSSLEDNRAVSSPSSFEIDDDDSNIGSVIPEILLQSRAKRLSSKGTAAATAVTGNIAGVATPATSRRSNSGLDGRKEPMYFECEEEQLSRNPFNSDSPSEEFSPEQYSSQKSAIVNKLDLPIGSFLPANRIVLSERGYSDNEDNKYSSNGVNLLADTPAATYTKLCADGGRGNGRNQATAGGQFFLRVNNINDGEESSEPVSYNQIRNVDSETELVVHKGGQLSGVNSRQRTPSSDQSPTKAKAQPQPVTHNYNYNGFLQVAAKPPPSRRASRELCVSEIAFKLAEAAAAAAGTPNGCKKGQLLKCKLSEHNSERIMLICVEPYCEARYRLSCGYCGQLHAKHSKSLLRVDEYREKVLEKGKAASLITKGLPLKNDAKDGGRKATTTAAAASHSQLIKLCQTKYDEMQVSLHSHFTNSLARIKGKVEQRKLQITATSSAVEEELKELTRLLGSVEQNELDIIGNRDLLRLHRFSIGLDQFTEVKQVSDAARERSLALLDERLYAYHLQLKSLVTRLIADSETLLYEVIAKMDEEKEEGTANSLMQSKDKAGCSGGARTKRLTSREKKTSYTAQKEVRLTSPPMEVRQRQKERPSLQKNNRRPIKRDTASRTLSRSPVAEEEMNQSCGGDRSGCSIPVGFTEIKSLPLWCEQMPQVARIAKRIDSSITESNNSQATTAPTTIAYIHIESVHNAVVGNARNNQLIIQDNKTYAVYVGALVNKLKNGYGVEYSKKEQTCYQGNWKNNRKKGAGRLIAKHDIMYEGNFEDDRRCGFGVLYQFGGKRYEGNWRDDKFEGHGVQHFESGDVFEGEFADGVKEGTGEYRSFDGSVLKGEWSKDVIGGHCTLVKGDGSTYTGEYMNGKRHGFGTFIWNDGRKYVGCWVEGVQHGNGIATSSQGVVVHAVWKHGKRVQIYQDEIIEENH